MSKFIQNRLQTLAYLSLAALILGFIGTWHWFAELFSHFVPYYAIILLLAALLTPHIIKRSIFGIVAIVLFFWLAQPISRFQAALPNAPTHSLIWYNVHLDNPNPAQEIHIIQQKQPEIIALAEINISHNAWKPLMDAYPHGCIHEEYSPFALAVRARVPLAKCEIFYQDDIPYIRAQLNDGTTVYALHPPPPITADLARIRLAYLHTVSKKIAQENKVLAIGDLNATPFSPVYRQFLRDTQLQTALPHFVPTWLPFGLQIDHVLQHNLPTIYAEPLPWGESDHRALWISW